MAQRLHWVDAGSLPRGLPRGSPRGQTQNQAGGEPPHGISQHQHYDAARCRAQRDSQADFASSLCYQKPKYPVNAECREEKAKRGKHGQKEGIESRPDGKTIGALAQSFDLRGQGGIELRDGIAHRTGSKFRRQRGTDYRYHAAEFVRSAVYRSSRFMAAGHKVFRIVGRGAAAVADGGDGPHDLRTTNKVAHRVYM